MSSTTKTVTSGGFLSYELVNSEQTSTADPSLVGTFQAVLAQANGGNGSGGTAANSPEDAYATVSVNGTVVATLYNNGTARLTNEAAAQVGSLPSMGEGETAVGPELAQKRAQEIAKALGGTISTASTAQSQGEWRLSDANAATAAQIAGQDTGPSPAAQAADAKAAFRRLAKAAQDGPAALLRAQYLESKGLTEDDVAAMTPEERKKIEEEIKEFIKKSMEEETGISVDETSVSTVA